MSTSRGIPIVCSTGSFWMWGLEKSLGVIAEAGFKGAELMVSREPRSQSPEHPLRIARRNGIAFAAVHAPMLVVTRAIWGPNFMPIITRSVDLAIQLEAPVVIIHPPYLWEVRYQQWLMRDVDRYSAEQGIAIAVENMFRLWLRGRPIRGHRWVSPADLKRFSQVTLDTSHCGVDGFDVLDALDEFGPSVAHVHLSDSYGNHRDNHALPGLGNLPLDRFLDKLKGSGFQGAVSLELDMREFADDTSKAVEALRRAREFCEEHLA